MFHHPVCLGMNFIPVAQKCRPRFRYEYLQLPQSPTLKDILEALMIKPKWAILYANTYHSGYQSVEGR